MCGIVGYFDYRAGQYRLDGDTFDAMIDSLAHRGPDGRGRHQAPGVGLGHRRLSIIDPHPRAAQPMRSPDGQVLLTYNGEIYNFRGLRGELEKLGHAFRTTSDTEVLLHAYLEWGTDCLARLDGIFAFGLYDARADRLLLARDPIGVKPLFYADWEGKVFFASEMTPLLMLPGLDTSHDPQGIDAYLAFSYVPAPRTGCRHIRQLLPGQRLELERGRKKFATYWELPLDAPPLEGDPPELTEEFDRRLARAVERQMVSDVPLGGFLSAGTDSFAVVRAMQQAARGRARAYTIGFADPRFDELPWTKQAARALDVHLDWQVARLEDDELWRRVAPHCVEPFADSSALPVYLLCEMASRHVKVALSGDGGDELLAGYVTYRATPCARAYRKLPPAVRRTCAALAQLVPDAGGKYTLGEQARRFVYGAENGRWRDHASWRILLPRKLRHRLYRPAFRRELGDFDPLELYAEPMRRAARAGCSELNCLLYADQIFYLPNDMLAKVDRMSMAHGLEVRVPLLDRELVEFCWRLPEEMKLRGRRGKHVLRRAIAGAYPPALRRRPKSGFNLACGPEDDAPVPVDLPFCRPARLAGGNTFGRYHRLMLRHLLRMLSWQARRAGWSG